MSVIKKGCSNTGSIYFFFHLKNKSDLREQTQTATKLKSARYSITCLRNHKWVTDSQFDYALKLDFFHTQV